MYNLLKYILCVTFLISTEGKISDQRLCGDPTCSSPVSLAKTLIRYNSDDSRIVSFPPNVEVRVFSKSAGTRTDLWGVEIGGKRGYAPKNLLREHKVLNRQLEFLVSTEDQVPNAITTEPTPDIPAIVSPSAESKEPESSPLPQEIRRPYEVHDGTTFFLTPSSDDELPPPPPIQASTTVSSAVDTAQPAQVDEPNASMVLPSPATSSSEFEPQEPAPDENEGSAKGIYNYISSFLPGDGSGSKESVVSSESSEEYEDDEDYEEEEEEESIEEEVALNTAIADNNSPLVNDLIDKKLDSKLPESEEISNNTSLPVVNEVDVGTESTVEESSAPAPAELSEEHDIIGQEEAKVEAQLIDNDSQLKPPAHSSEKDNFDPGNDETVSSTVESAASTHQGDVISQNTNIINPDSNPDETIPSAIDVISNSYPETPSVDIEVNSTSETQLVPDENSINSDSVTAETTIDSTDILSEKSVEDMEINREPPARSIFDIIANRESASEEIVRSEQLPTTDSPRDLGLVNMEGIAEVTVGLLPDDTTQATTMEVEPNITFPAEVQTDTLNEDNETIVDNSVLTDTNDVLEVETDTMIKDNETIIDNLVLTDTNDVLEVETDTLIEDNETIIDNSVLTDTNDVLEDLSNASPGEPDKSDEGTGYLSIVMDFLSSVFTSTSPPNPIVDVDTDATAIDIEQTVESEERQQTDKYTPTLSDWLANNAGSHSQSADGKLVDTDSTYPILPPLSKVVEETMSETNGPAISLIITALTVLLFTLGYYFIEKSRQDSTFIAKINNLERSLFVTTKECQLVKDDLETTKGMLTVEHTSLTSNESLTDELYTELEERRAAAAQYEEQIQTLQLELESATDAGLEVNRMLTEVLSQNGSTDSLFESIETLQSQLKAQQTTILQMNELLKQKNSEVDELNEKLAAADLMRMSIIKEMDKLKQSISDLRSEKENEECEYKNVNKTLVSELETLRVKLEGHEKHSAQRLLLLENQLAEAEEEVDRCNEEYKKLKERWLQVKVDGEGNLSITADDLETMMDVGHAEVNAIHAEDKNKVLEEKLKDEQSARALLEDHNRRMDEELCALRTACTTAEVCATQANNKLEILTMYFNEKEAAMSKDLGLRESVVNQATGEVTTIHEKLMAVTEQNRILEEENGTLRQEIIEQERQRKDQAKAMEAKFNENWLFSKQLERKLEEAKIECSVLRNRLLISERGNTSAEQSTTGESRLANDLNGDLPTSPLHMGLVDIPPHGIPFMPPPSYPQDRRPPPLGCMSSPPLLPPPVPGHYPTRHYDRHSPDRHSPSFRGRGFRPLPPPANKNKGSNPGSSHSSESSNHQG